MSEKEELKNEAYEGSKILFENDDIMFLKCNSYEAAKYFAPNSYLPKLWNEYKNKDIFILVDKKGNDWVTTKSYTIIPHDYTTDYLDDEFQKINPTTLFHWYPEAEDIIYKHIPAQDIYQILRKVKSGNEFTSDTLNRYDDLVGGFKFNQKLPGKSMVTLKFDDNEDYFNLFDLNEGDMWFLRNLFSYYGSYDMGFYHSDLAYEDWKQGYLLYELNEENKKKVIEIAYLFDNTITTFDDDTTEKIAKILEDNFERETNEMINEYQSLKEQCMSETAKDEITQELCDPFTNYGIFTKSGCFYSYVTTVNVLLSLYKMSQNYDLTLRELLGTFAKQMSVGPYEEYMYEYGCNDLDIDSYNREVSRQLENIDEKIEDSGFFTDIELYKKIVSQVLSIYKMKKWYKTPKDKDRTFWIESIDPKTNKINIRTQKPFQSLEKRSLTLDEFNSFLYNLEIFERKIVKSKKRL
jgi:hypothetical protein